MTLLNFADVMMSARAAASTTGNNETCLRETHIQSWNRSFCGNLPALLLWAETNDNLIQQGVHIFTAIFWPHHCLNSPAHSIAYLANTSRRIAPKQQRHYGTCQGRDIPRIINFTKIELRKRPRSKPVQLLLLLTTRIRYVVIKKILMCSLNYAS